MKVESFQLGPYQTNCYLINIAQRAYLIDPADEGDFLVATIKRRGWSLKGIILTHSHWDHLLGLSSVAKAFSDAPIYIHKAESQFLGKEGGLKLQQLALTLDPRQAHSDPTRWREIPEATNLLEGGEVIDGCNFLVIHTPGHTQGSISLYHKESLTLFSGDTLFRGSIGRTDLPNGDYKEILNSIREKLLPLDDSTIVYPGHGPATTIGAERQFNRWL